MAHGKGNLTPELEKWVRGVFELADKDRSGSLSHTELKRVLHKSDELREDFRDGGGRTWKDFWKELDEDGSGNISLEELQDYFRKNISTLPNLAESLQPKTTTKSAKAAAAVVPDDTDDDIRVLLEKLRAKIHTLEGKIETLSSGPQNAPFGGMYTTGLLFLVVLLAALLLGLIFDLLPFGACLCQRPG